MPTRLRRFTTALFFALFAVTLACSAPATERKFSTPSTLRLEIRQLLSLLEQYHYNRDAVRPASYSGVIADYMGAVDGQRLFFLASDKAAFEKRYSNNLYYNVHDLGNIDAAYEIFAVYDQRSRERIAWINEELKRDFDLTQPDSYCLDRSKAEWPETPAAADTLWRSRLKFEIGSEVLNKKTVEEAREIVRKRYERMLKNIAELEGADLAELFLTSITQLYDPHSTYMSAENFKDFDIKMKLQLVGIGAMLSMDKEDYCVVRELVPGGPADLEKSLKPNDKIIAVAQGDGEPVEVIGMKLRRIVELIRGTKGTQVRLIVQPGSATDSSTRKEISIIRDVVKLDSARAHAAVFDIPSSNGQATIPLGVISLPSFYGNESEADDGVRTSAAQDVAELITRLQAEKVQGIVLDLRRNGGGLLSEAIDLTGLFIKTGPVVQVRNFESRINVNGDEDPKIAYDGPLAVIVDRFSASASEIVAGALQNYGRAIIVGDSSTHGKGSVQQVIPMSEVLPTLLRPAGKTGAAKLTIQKFYLPSGASTQLKGVVPDIVLPSFEDYLPVGESDLPHALVWDEIPSSFFNGKPLQPTLITPLRSASQRRQETLDEFAYLKRSIEWFKQRQEQKTISLNIDDRRRQKESDDAFDKTNKAEREKIAQGAYPYREIRIVPAPPPRIKAPDEKPADESETPILDDESDEAYPKSDVHLREALRILADALQLGQNPEVWSDPHAAPLTAQAVRR
ncbi:MAG TPA: carboxy terminal-processing peptidase [Opitutaceae bacterium]|nr:carboxy terminal-processing peptidase [Opitutaceae bacterium]